MHIHSLVHPFTHFLSLLFLTQAVFQIAGSPTDFPKTKEEYVRWGDEDPSDGSRGSRFVRPLEPYMPQRPN